MKSIFLCLTFLTLSICASAQWAFESWHDGKIVLESGDTLKGQVKYDLQQDLVQYIDKRGTVEVFSARKILLCEIFDELVKQYRQFYSLPYSTTSGYKTLVLFELIGEGKLTIFCRERLEMQTSNYPYYYGGSFSRYVLVNKYFILNDKGSVEDLSSRRADIMSLFGKHEKNINDYMKENRLRLDDKQDFIRILAYYNSLFKK
jgi:hypothetical protein